MAALSRRAFLGRSLAAAGALALGRFTPGCATLPAASTLRQTPRPLSGDVIDLHIARTRVRIGGRDGVATTINGLLPGPELRLREGQDAVIRVHNALDVETSLHWHGILVPPEMDGVPGISFDGIAPGETFEYRFPVRQTGTYWYHSHSGMQEQTGLYGSLVIEPAAPADATWDREHTLVLADWTFEDPHAVLAHLQKYGGYYNFQRRTLANLGDEAASRGLWHALGDRFDWAAMRMDSTDISDVTGATYTYLLNGQAPAEDWRAAFTPGERVRLRVINASAATYFDLRIPGLAMTVVEADGNPIAPVEVDELRLAVAETWDVIVTPAAGAYAIFAEAMDRSGYARGTLTSDPLATAAIPARRPRPVLTMDDMGMDHMGPGAHGTHDMNDMHDMHGMHAGHAMSAAGPPASRPARPPSSQPANRPATRPATRPSGAPLDVPASCRTDLDVIARHGDDGHGPGNAMVAELARARLDDPGVGLRDAPWRVLTYAALRRATPVADHRPPDRTIELHLTGNMERYMWSFDGEQYHMDMPDIRVRHGERVRFVLVNDTMMAHPIHLHGMFVELDVGACEHNPLKHTVNVKPAERLSFVLDATEPGRWAFHCHILYHMDSGMFRVVEVYR